MNPCYCSCHNLLPFLTDYTRMVSCLRQYLLPYTRCDKIVSRLKLFLHNIKTYLLTYIVPFRVIFMGFYTASPAITPLFEAFPKVSCLKLGKYISQSCFNHGNIIKSPSNTILSFWKRKKSHCAKSGE